MTVFAEYLEHISIEETQYVQEGLDKHCRTDVFDLHDNLACGCASNNSQPSAFLFDKIEQELSK
jgi:hypothetical protein